MAIIKSLLARSSLFHGMRQAQGTRMVASDGDPVATPGRAHVRPDAHLTALEREDLVLIGRIRQSLYVDA